MNGCLWTVQSMIPDRHNCLLYMDLIDDVGHRVEVVAHEDGFFDIENLRDHQYDQLDLFDYGYCLTCHKAQGSEWNNVVVIDQTSNPGFAKMCHENRSGLTADQFAQRWFYTAVTRAKHKVVLMGESI